MFLKELRFHAVKREILQVSTNFNEAYVCREVELQSQTRGVKG